VSVCVCVCVCVRACVRACVLCCDGKCDVFPIFSHLHDGQHCNTKPRQVSSEMIEVGEVRVVHDQHVVQEVMVLSHASDATDDVRQRQSSPTSC
jgi:hypothetical protein